MAARELAAADAPAAPPLEARRHALPARGVSHLRRISRGNAAGGARSLLERDGTSFPVEYTCTPVRAKTGADRVIRHVPRRQRAGAARAQIRQAQKMRRSGSSRAASPRLQQPATVIKGRSELLRRPPPADAIHSRDFDLIQADGDRAAALVGSSCLQPHAAARAENARPQRRRREMSTMLRRMIGEQIELQTPTIRARTREGRSGRSSRCS